MTASTRGVSSVIIQSFRSRELAGSYESVVGVYSDRLRVRHLKRVTTSARMPSTPSTGPRINGNRLTITCLEQFMSCRMERNTPIRRTTRKHIAASSWGYKASGTNTLQCYRCLMGGSKLCGLCNNSDGARTDSMWKFRPLGEGVDMTCTRRHL